MTLVIAAPVSGEIIPMRDVPDPVFSAMMVGPGAAIAPFPGGLTVVAPCAGTVRKVQAHGVLIDSGDGMGVLVHLGLDTCELDGEGFDVLVKDGQEVTQGQPLVLWNTSVATEEGYSLCSPIVVVGADKNAVSIVAQGPKVEAGKPFLHVEQ
ncbi:MAG: PTS sugar transporter subunit IIA [Ancrocorticia populi]|uniref:PTS sugar transporter subunit IIA n=1 Tax=Ancrocorticia populi TaxID=2175228 RepID=UPI003F908FE7